MTFLSQASNPGFQHRDYMTLRGMLLMGQFQGIDDWL